MPAVRDSGLVVRGQFRTSSLAGAMLAIFMLCPCSIGQERAEADDFITRSLEQETAVQRDRAAIEELQRQKRMLEEQLFEMARKHSEQGQRASKLEAELKKAQARLAELTARQEAAKAEAMRVFQMRHIRPQNLAEVLHGVLGKNMPRIAVDDRSNALLVAGNEKQLAIVGQLADTLDKPAAESEMQKPGETLQVRVVWLLDVDEGMEPNDKLVSPQVVEALGELGFQHPKVVCQQVTTLTLSDPIGDNRHRGQFNFAVPVLIKSQPWEFEGQGQIVSMADDRFNLQFEMEFQQHTGQGGNRSRINEGRLGGSIYTPLGNYTVMGTTTFVASSPAPVPEDKQPGDFGTGGMIQKQHLSAFVVYLDRAREFPGTGAEPVDQVDVHP